MKNRRNLENFTKIEKIRQKQQKPQKATENSQKMMQNNLVSGWNKNPAVARGMFKAGENIRRKTHHDRESKKKKIRFANQKFMRCAHQKVCASRFEDGFSSNYFAFCAANFSSGVHQHLGNRGHLLAGTDGTVRTR